MQKAIITGALAKKLALRLLLLVVLPVTVALSILFGILQQATSRESRTSNLNLLNQLSASISINRAHLETLARAMEENSSLVTFLGAAYLPRDSYANYDRVVAENIKGFARSIPSVSVAVFMSNQTIPSGYNLFYSDDYLKNISELSSFLKSETRTQWFDVDQLMENKKLRTSHPFFRPSNTMLLLRKIKLYDDSTIGYIAIFVPQSYLLSFANVPIERMENCICVNYAQEKISEKTRKDLVGLYEGQKENSHQVFGAIKLENIPLSLVIITQKENQYIVSLIVSIIVSCCILISFLIFSGYVHKLVADIQRCISDVQASVTNQFHYRLQNATQPEIIPITQSVNVLLDRIASLVDEAMVQQEVSRQAQLAALQNQINPHFLYNTLEVMAGRMELHQLYEESDALTSFAQIFRYNMSTKDSKIAQVREELAIAQRYVQVLHLSRRNVQLHTRVDADCLSYPILRFCLQPLLENCILHGLRTPSDYMDIWIEIIKVESSLRVRVSDNGKGMSKEQVLQLNRSLEAQTVLSNHNPSSHIGLLNINSRLQLVYGTHLQIASEPEHGTVVFFEICQTPFSQQMTSGF